MDRQHESWKYSETHILVSPARKSAVLVWRCKSLLTAVFDTYLVRNRRINDGQGQHPGRSPCHEDE
jgi:hypothetical protein